MPDYRIGRQPIGSSGFTNAQQAFLYYNRKRRRLLAGGGNLPKLPAGSPVALLGDSIFRRGAFFTTSSVRTTAENRHNNELMWYHYRTPRIIHRNWWDPTSIAANRIPDFGGSMADDTYFSGLNFGYSSDTATGINLRVEQVIASGALLCVINAGTNVGTTDALASTTIAALQQAVETLRAAGVRVIIGTIRPRRVSETPTGSEISPANMARIIEINAAIRANWAAWGANALWDPWEALRDPAYDINHILYGSILAAYAISDGVHLSPLGSYVSSLSLDAPMNSQVQSGNWFANLTNMLVNGAMDGTGGVTGGGVIGTVPTGWTLQNAQGAGQPVTVEATAADGALTMVITSTGAGAAGSFNTIRLNPSTTISSSNFASTDWLVSLNNFEVVTPGDILVQGQCTLGQTSTISARGHGQSTSQFNTEPSPFGSFAMSGWIATEPLLAEARTNVNPRLDLNIRQDVAGSCVVRVPEAALVKVTSPETDFPWVP